MKAASRIKSYVGGVPGNDLVTRKILFLTIFYSGDDIENEAIFRRLF